VQTINTRIEMFNMMLLPTWSDLSIDKRVSRVEYDKDTGLVTCFDRDGNKCDFLTITKQDDGQFECVIAPREIETDSRSRSSSASEFYLTKDQF
jgi:hypothetical protein